MRSVKRAFAVCLVGFFALSACSAGDQSAVETSRAVVIISGGGAISPFTTPDEACSSEEGFLEAGNTTSSTEMVNLICSMRMFEANQRVIQTHDEHMGKIISELGNPS